jgi:predicted dehydrogenase
MNAAVRIGCVGCGAHAVGTLYPALYHAPLEVISVCDRDPERMERAQRQFGAQAGFTALEQMLDGPELDALIVCGPPELHYQAALQAMDRGLHVFVEKPPAPSLAATLELRRVAQATGRQCAVGFMKRFALRYQQAKAIAASEPFGSLTQLTIKYSHWPTPNLRWMLDFMTIHLCDLARYFAGDLERITIETKENAGQFSFSMVGRAKAGCLVSLITSSHEPRIKERVELVGEGEVVVVDNVIELQYFRRVDPSRLFTSDLYDLQVVRPDFAIPSLAQNSLFLQGYAGEIIDFAEALLEYRAPAATIDDGVMAMRMIDLLSNHTSGTFTLADWS